jgi:ubiquinone/menaquinone biosynthesis C-methylase UbiE
MLDRCMHRLANDAGKILVDIEVEGFVIAGSALLFEKPFKRAQISNQGAPPMGTAKRFWNWTAERYSRQSIADEVSYKKKLEMTQKYLSPDMRVIEFGCGTGATAVMHAPLVKSYHAIDVSENMIEIAREKTTSAQLSNVQLTVGTLEEAKLPDACCEAILGLNILHLVPDLDETLATIARVLASGGRFFSSTVCLNDLQGSLRRLAMAARILPFLPTVGSFSVDEFKGRVERAGFRIDECFEQAPGVVFLIATKESG